MATSGTVATTVLDTAVVLEHACRRCGIPASSQTPEIVDIGKQNLYLILLNLANRGLNLWCVENELYPVATDTAEYALNPGTIRLLNVNYSANTRVEGTDTVGASDIVTDLTTASKVVRWGFKLDAGVTGTMVLEYSDDGITYTAAQALPSTAWGTTWHWYNLDPVVTAQYWRVTSSVAATFDEFYLADAYTDTVMTQFSRDEYSQQPQKYTSSRPVTNFYFDKTVDPSIVLWPVPNNAYDVVSLWRHRFVQDVGTLTQQIEIPQQWMESLIWMLSARLAYEAPGVDPARRMEVVTASERFLTEAELGETDNAPIFMYSAVSVYTA